MLTKEATFNMDGSKASASIFSYTESDNSTFDGSSTYWKVSYINKRNGVPHGRIFSKGFLTECDAVNFMNKKAN